MEANTEIQEEIPKFCAFLDGIVTFVGKWFAWLNLALIFVIIVQVVIRYGFSKGNVPLEEMQFIFYGMMLILAISFTMVENGHIRLDLLHTRFKRRTKEKVEVFGIIFLLIPTILVVGWFSLDLLATSWRAGEMSENPQGLCCRWAFKAFFPAGMGLWLLAAVSRMVKGFVYLKNNPKEST